MSKRNVPSSLEGYKPFPTALCPIFVGYVSLEDWVLAADPAHPVYAHLLLEKEYTEDGRRIDHHSIVVGQPDGLNRVHYCLIPVAQVVYINSVPFNPDYEATLAQEQQTYEAVVAWLAMDLTVKRGMVAMPEGLMHIHGRLPRELQEV